MIMLRLTTFRNELLLGLSWLLAALVPIFCSDVKVKWIHDMLTSSLKAMLVIFFLLAVRNRHAGLAGFARACYFPNRKTNLFFFVFMISVALWTIILAQQQRNFTMEVMGVCDKNKSILRASEYSVTGIFLDPPITLGPFASDEEDDAVEKDESSEQQQHKKEDDEQPATESPLSRIHVDRTTVITFTIFLFWSCSGFLAHVLCYGYHEPLITSLDQALADHVGIWTLIQLQFGDIIINILIGALPKLAFILFEMSPYGRGLIWRQGHPPVIIFMWLTIVDVYTSCSPVAPISVREFVRVVARDISRAFAGGARMEATICETFDLWIAKNNVPEVAEADASSAMEASQYVRAALPVVLLDPGQTFIHFCLYVVIGRCVVFGSTLRRCVVPRTMKDWRRYFASSRRAVCDGMLQGAVDRGSGKRDEIIAEFLSGNNSCFSRILSPYELHPHGMSALTDHVVWPVMSRGFFRSIIDTLAFHQLLDTGVFSPVADTPRGAINHEKQHQQQPSLWRKIKMSVWRSSALYFADVISVSADVPFGRACRVLREVLFLAPFETAEGFVAQSAGIVAQDIMSHYFDGPLHNTQQKLRVVVIPPSSTITMMMRLPDNERLNSANFILDTLNNRGGGITTQISACLSLLQNPNFLFCVRRALDWCRYSLLSASSSSSSSPLQQQQQQQKQLVHVHEFTRGRRQTDLAALFQCYPDAQFNSNLPEAVDATTEGVRNLVFFELLLVRILALLQNVALTLGPVLEVLVADAKLRGGSPQLAQLRNDMVTFLREGLMPAIGLTSLDAMLLCEAGEFSSNIPKEIVLAQKESFRRPVASRFAGNRVAVRAHVAGIVPLIAVAESDSNDSLSNSSSDLSHRCAAAFALHVAITRGRRQDRFSPSFTACSLSAHLVRTIVSSNNSNNKNSFASPVSLISRSDGQLRRNVHADSKQVVANLSSFFSSSESPERSVLFQSFFGRTAPRDVPNDFTVVLMDQEERLALPPGFNIQDAPPHLPPEHINTSISGVPCYVMAVDEAMVVLSHCLTINSQAGSSAVDMLVCRDAAYLLCAASEFLIQTRCDVAGAHPLFARVVPAMIVVGHTMLDHNLAARSTTGSKCDEGDPMLVADEFGRIYSTARMRLEMQVCMLCAHALCRAFACAPPPVAAALVLGVQQTSHATSVLAAVVSDESVSLRNAVLARSVMRPGVEVVSAAAASDDDDRVCTICLGPLNKPPPDDAEHDDADARKPAVENKLVNLKNCRHSFHLSCCAAFLANQGQQQQQVIFCPTCRSEIK